MSNWTEEVHDRESKDQLGKARARLKLRVVLVWWMFNAEPAGVPIYLAVEMANKSCSKRGRGVGGPHVQGSLVLGAGGQILALSGVVSRGEEPGKKYFRIEQPAANPARV